MTRRCIDALKEWLLTSKSKISKKEQLFRETSGWVSDAGTRWPGHDTLVAEYETIDFDLLLKEIDKFSEVFND